MTTYIPFAPRPRSAFQFQPVLDGTARRAEVRWSLFGQRWYVSVFTLTGTRVFTLPMVGSDDPVPATTAAWDGTRERVVVTSLTPHGFEIGIVVGLVFRGFAPDAYNVAADCVVLDPYNVAYAATVDPGVIATAGTLAQEIDIAAGYFSSSLVYRTSANRFEVNP